LVLQTLLDLIFPPICLACDKFGYYVCPKCRKDMTKLEEFICPKCLMTCPDGKLHSGCKSDVDGLISCWNYEKTTQKVIKEIKYRFYYAGIKELMSRFFRYRQQSALFAEFVKNKPIIIPVPLHTKRLKYRGFNQAELIAKEISKVWDLPMSSKILIRTKFTKPQAELSKEERQQNTKDMFAFNPKILKLGEKPLLNKNVLLVDDVWTTGSTAQACTRILKKLGAEKVWVVTVAR